jgi:TRAP-type mannitol/chloroaromatic compound transport system permease small subunit
MKFVYAIEGLSLWVGRAFGWCIMILTLSVVYEVFVRYVLNSPTVWAFDMMIQMYGALFLMCGAYALAQDTHVRADVIYRLFPVRVQAGLDFVLYFLFFFPGILALVWYAPPAFKSISSNLSSRFLAAFWLSKESLSLYAV